MKIKLAILLFLFAPTFLMKSSGQSFTGQVLDSKTRKALAYVNIGIPSAGLGIITDEEGRYTLPLDPEFSTDTIQFSYIGYKSVLIPVSDFMKTYLTPASSFLMEEKAYNLSEVTVRPKKGVKEVMGNTISKVKPDDCVAIIDLLDSAVTKAQNDTLNTKKRKRKPNSYAEKHVEVGTLFEIKKRYTYIDKIQIQFCEAAFDSVKLRLNIYCELEDHKVKGILKVFTKYTNVLKSPVYFTVHKNATLVEIDLSAYNIGVSDDFIVAIETLKTEDNKKIMIPAETSFGGEPMVIHYTNGTPFVKLPIVKIGFSASISY